VKLFPHDPHIHMIDAILEKCLVDRAENCASTPQISPGPAPATNSAETMRATAAARIVHTTAGTMPAIAHVQSVMTMEEIIGAIADARSAVTAEASTHRTAAAAEGVRRRSYNWLLINAEILGFRLACIYTF